MPKSDTFAGQSLALALNGNAYPWAAAGALWVALHTAAPGNDQAGNETAYSGYERLSVARDGSGWSVTGGVAANLSRLVFPQNNGGSVTITHLSLGLASSGAGTVLYVGELDSPLVINALDAPVFEAGGLQIEEV